ncbi:DUF5949 family protein [Streptomyces sp. TRM76323]|uniref:DUF5949 family protein n=1 Tax=Streptomyces tamarix TaxID=3078565 RepID=A0ABU3QQ30_9ACTN|nr:DUF5949 family protein [Streptomyces tamarix]MDT9684861.1 DUF5949 family protein [Streptomyces tamarix]
MTSSTAVSPDSRRSPLGTLTVIPWCSEPTADDPGDPLLMVYSLGDGRDGPEAGEEAMRAQLDQLGLPIGERLVDLGRDSGFSSSLLVEAEQAVLTLPFLRVRCPVPPEWQRAAHAKGQVYLIIAVRPWPRAVPGRAVPPEELRAFVSGEGFLEGSAHCLLPVLRVRT